jgi:hypothetical protein
MKPLHTPQHTRLEEASVFEIIQIGHWEPPIIAFTEVLCQILLVFLSPFPTLLCVIYSTVINL